MRYKYWVGEMTGYACEDTQLYDHQDIAMTTRTHSHDHQDTAMTTRTHNHNHQDTQS